MKIYIARYFESSKGLSLEGIRYKKIDDKFIGVYCSYFIKHGLFNIDTIKSNYISMVPVSIIYSNEKKSYLIDEN